MNKQQLEAKVEEAWAESGRLRIAIMRALGRDIYAWTLPADDVLIAELNQHAKQNTRMRAALEAVEYEYLINQCPWCKAIYGYPHNPDCARQIALGITSATSGADSAA